MLKQKQIKAILFDLDGTLRFSRPTGTATFANRAAEIGLSISHANRLNAARWEHTYWAQSTDLLQDAEKFDEKEDAFWLNYSYRQLLALGLSDENAATYAPQLHTFMKDHYKPEDWIPPNTHQVLPQLINLGYTLAVVSNRTQPYDDYLAEKGIQHYFRFSLAAGTIGIWKPDVGIFEHAIQKLNHAPQQVLYVGDNYYADVVGARAAGLQPMLIDPDGLFENPDCPVISSIEEIVTWLETS